MRVYRQIRTKAVAAAWQAAARVTWPNLKKPSPRPLPFRNEAISKSENVFARSAIGDYL